MIKNNYRVYIVLLTWQRLPNLKQTLLSLSKQTYKNFSIYISNANVGRSATVEKYARNFKTQHNLDIEISHDGNDIFAFRRFTVGKLLAERGADIVMYIDDDISFGPKYIESILSQYEPKSYCSGFAWNFQHGGKDYYRYRTKRFDNKEKIHYCGTGVSAIDAKIFLQKGLLDAPKEAYQIEDLWLSYYAQHVMGWKLKYVEIPDFHIGGSDSVALYKKILGSEYTKADFLRLLVKEYGWKL
jgi:GT2 family glycosyltransferase